MSGALLRLVATPYAAVTGPAFLEHYDPDAYDGAGHSTWTADPAQAMVFVDVIAALAAWRVQSTVRPFRDDGKPNCPLTAFTVEAVRL